MTDLPSEGVQAHRRVLGMPPLLPPVAPSELQKDWAAAMWLLAEARWWAEEVITMESTWDPYITVVTGFPWETP